MSELHQHMRHLAKPANKCLRPKAVVAILSRYDCISAGAAISAAGSSLKYERQVYGDRLELHFGLPRPARAIQQQTISGR